MEQTKTPHQSASWRRLGVFGQTFETKLAADFEHSRPTDRTFSFECRFAVLHRDFCGFIIFAFRATFYAIKGCHSR